MLEPLQIQSSRGPYLVQFKSNVFSDLAKMDLEKTQFIFDEKVAALYKEQISSHLACHKITQIAAIESNKNLDRVSGYVQKLMDQQIKIDHTLVAVGGGIIQDITCFLASTLFRGMKWELVPTTLLAQADSCIGSKSSINVGPYKNLMGTFLPPQTIHLDVQFLSTLDRADLHSGMGEILKVHMIKGPADFEALSQEFESILSSPTKIERAIYQSLLIKKTLIETDEFDRGPRNVMNYGHSYGHAIETATDFKIPHGVAVTIGMDMANFQSLSMGRITGAEFDRWHVALAKNYRDFSDVSIPLDKFVDAISRDKKNTGSDLGLILVQSQKGVEKVKVKNDQTFKKNCTRYFEEVLGGQK